MIYRRSEEVKLSAEMYINVFFASGINTELFTIIHQQHLTVRLTILTNVVSTGSYEMAAKSHGAFCAKLRSKPKGGRLAYENLAMIFDNFSFLIPVTLFTYLRKMYFCRMHNSVKISIQWRIFLILYLQNYLHFEGR